VRSDARHGRPGPAQELAGAGAKVAATPAEAAARGVVITMLADDEAVEAVTFGPHGIREGLPRGGVHVSMSTIGVELAERLAEAHRESEQRYLSAPVFGRPDAAGAAELFVVAAGPTTEVEGGGRFSNRCRSACSCSATSRSTRTS
jgi:3-hydroxyisobutyrate dehydrogenase-like beta-hydroxyacid dehydrogenase